MAGGLSIWFKWHNEQTKRDVFRLQPHLEEQKFG